MYYLLVNMDSYRTRDYAVGVIDSLISRYDDVAQSLRPLSLGREQHATQLSDANWQVIRNIF